jgi:hypothetical protein
MSPNDRLEALLDRWQESQARGVTLSAAELCADTPELLPEVSRRLVVLNHFEALRADPVADTPYPPPALTPVPEDSFPARRGPSRRRSRPSAVNSPATASPPS